MQFAGIISNIREKFFAGSPGIPEPVEGRRVVVEITTNGQNPDVVDSIIGKLRSYNVDIDIFVVKEEIDLHTYAAQEITVPSIYETPNGSRTKLRALHYAINALHRMGYGKNDYIIHLDDDSIVEKDYIRYVFGMRGLAGQGEIRLRDYGAHLLSTLADFIRVSDCDVYCRHFNRKGKAMFVHGEGLVVRADIEYEFGWDYATYGADDVIMGNLVSKKYGFGRIPYHIFISPPLSAGDFYKQRRRWLTAIVYARRKLWDISPRLVLFLFYRYIVGWTGIFGIGYVIYSLVFGFIMPVPILVMSLFNTVSYFAIYQYGALQTNRKYSPVMLILQYVISIYEAATLWYSLIYPPDTSKFDVIRKASVRDSYEGAK
jgi:cellulose synthase/poly-beta-1,6-N-acetylglucosamine synthase-like glycosyltransferase